MADDPIADATPTTNPLNLSNEASNPIGDGAASNVVLEYRNTPGPTCVDAFVALDFPLPQTLVVNGVGFTLCGTTLDGRPIYGSV